MIILVYDKEIIQSVPSVIDFDITLKEFSDEYDVVLMFIKKHIKSNDKKYNKKYMKRYCEKRKRKDDNKSD